MGFLVQNRARIAKEVAQRMSAEETFPDPGKNSHSKARPGRKRFDDRLWPADVVRPRYFFRHFNSNADLQIGRWHVPLQRWEQGR